MNKVALITGSTSGIGLAVAKTMLKDHQDQTVIIAGTNDEAVQQTLQSLRAHHANTSLDGVVMRVNEEQSVSDAFSYIEQKYGRLDVLFNNAGVNPYMDDAELSVKTFNVETLAKTLDVNTYGAICVMQHAVKLMAKNGSGRIINTSTEMASLNLIKNDYYPLSPSYRISKVALNAATVLFAKELEGSGITVNSYSPGWTKTNIGGDSAPFTPEEAAETAIYLATDRSVNANGQFFAELRKFGGPIVLPW